MKETQPGLTLSALTGLGVRNLLKTVLRKENTDARVTNLHGATELIHELGERNALNALEEICTALTDLNKLEGVSLKERVRTTLYLDEKSMPLCTPILATLFDGSATMAVSPRTLGLVTELWRVLGLSYVHCLSKLAESGAASSDQARAVIVRSLSLNARIGECMLLRYYDVSDRVWRSMQKVYSLAEEVGIAHARIRCYPSDEQTTTPAALFVRLQVLAQLPIHQMRTAQLYAFIEWLRNSDVRLEVTTQCQATTTHVFYPDAHRPAEPVRRNSAGNGAHFFSARAVCDALTGTPLAEALQSPVSEEADADRYTLLDLVRLALQGRSRPFRRQSARKAADDEVRPYVGLFDTIKWLRQPGAAMAPDATPQYSFDSWFTDKPKPEAGEPGVAATPCMVDIGAGGFAITLAVELLNDVGVGDLLGAARKDIDAPLLGTVAHINRDAAGNVTLGVETLLGDISLATLHNPVNRQSFEVIVLAGRDEDNNDGLLLVPQNRAVVDGVFLLARGKEVTKVRLHARPCAPKACLLMEMTFVTG